MGFLDLHNHILPGLDDGAHDWSESLKMARMAVEDGVEGVVCTPHWVQGRYDNTRPLILDTLSELRQRLADHDIPLKLYPGAELRLDAGLLRAIRNGDLLTLNDGGRFALIELPETDLPQNLEAFLWELQMQNITPVISHPERNPELFKAPMRLFKWVEKGILTQVTAASLSGEFGRQTKQFANLLLEHGMVHILATDAHGLKVRSPSLSKAYRIIEDKAGKEVATKMTSDTPWKIVRGESVIPEEPIALREQRFNPGPLKRWFPFFLKMAVIMVLAGCGGPAVQEIDPAPGVGLQWNKDKTRWELAPGKEEKAIQEIMTPQPQTAEAEALMRKTEESLSPRAYLMEKFKGKRVVFPAELPPDHPNGPAYRIGPEDEFLVFIWQNPDLSMDSIVREDGKISLPLVGEIHAGGLSIPELEGILKQKYAQYLEKPQVSVTVKTVNSLKVYITGAVRIPDYVARKIVSGFPLPPDRRLLSVLSQVEILPEADLKEAYVVRGETIIPLDIQKLLEDGEMNQNILLRTGDTVLIPNRTKRLTILGEVKTPGRHKVERRTRLLDALAVAGGINDQTACLDLAFVARGHTILPVNIKSLVETADLKQNTLMEDNDIIQIPSITDNKVFVLGEVKKPGVLHFKGPMDVIEAVSASGDFTDSAHRRQVVVVRGGIYDPKVYAINALSMMEGSTHERFILNRYDIVYVPRSLIGDWNWFIRQLIPTATIGYLIETIYD